MNRIELKNLGHITYRGDLKSCNYSCPYCVFACKHVSQAERLRDKNALQRFREFLTKTEFLEPISVLITPYGEALSHSYYWEELAKISRLSSVARISCQTNISFSDIEFLETLQKFSTNFGKISLWGSFHPSMISAKAFAEKANRLSEHISISVGAVGNPENLAQIWALQALLAPSIYLWINKMDGLKRKYTPEEKADFFAIDPLFSLELHQNKSYETCRGGKNAVFIEADGSTFPCPRSKKTLGNIYGDLSKIPDCKGRCDCFIAYSNRENIPELARLLPYSELRLKGSKPLRAVLFDIDDSIYFANDTNKTHIAQAFLVECHNQGLMLFPVTALTRRQAERRLGSAKKLLAGGIFAYGAYIEIDAENFHKVRSFATESPSPPLRKFAYKDEVYKLIVKKNSPEWAHYGAVYAEEYIAVVPHGASKKTGAAFIINKLGLLPSEMIIIGNSSADIALFSLADCTVAVRGAPQNVCEKARFVLEPERFLALLR